MNAQHSPRLPALFTALAALLTMAAPPGLALDNWINPATGLWTDNASWSNVLPPNGPANEEGRIDNGGTATIDSTQTDPFTSITGEITTGSLTLGSQPGATGHLSMSSGTFILKNTDFRIGGNPVTAIGAGVPNIGGTGVFTQTGGTVIQQGGNLNIGIRVANAAELSPSVAEGTYNLSGENSSYEVRAGFIVAIGNRAKGTLNQTGGNLVVKNLTATNGGTAGSRIQLGRNALNLTSYTSGTYNFSGGSATAALFHFGHAAQSTGSSINTFNLSGTGLLQIAEIEFLNTTTSTNQFNFTGGTLAANTVKIPVTNNGGTLAPYAINFTTVTALAGPTINPVGTMTFTGASSYTQASNGNLAIDISATGNDFVNIGAAVADVAGANLAGKITVNILDGIDPAVGSTFDILSADTVTSTAGVIGHTATCKFFRPDIVAGGNGQILRLTVVEPPSTYAEWQAIYQVGGFTANDDGDSMSNGLEYTMGTLPNDATGANGRLPVSSFVGTGAARHLRLEFTTADPSGTDITLQVQASSDLGMNDPWTTIASKVGQGAWTGPAAVTVGAANDCKVSVTVDDAASFDATSCRFLRLRAVTP